MNMNMQAQTPSQTIAAIARRHLEDAGGDWKRAAEAMSSEVRDNSELFMRLMTPLVDHAVWDAIRKAARDSRSKFRTVTNESGGKPRADQNGVRGLNEASKTNWFDYPLLNGVRLGDAKLDDVLGMIGHHKANAAMNAKKAQWLDALAKRLGNGKRVSEVYTSDEIAAIANRFGI